MQQIGGRYESIARAISLLRPDLGAIPNLKAPRTYTAVIPGDLRREIVRYSDKRVRYNNPYSAAFDLAGKLRTLLYPSSDVTVQHKAPFESATGCSWPNGETTIQIKMCSTGIRTVLGISFTLPLAEQDLFKYIGEYCCVPANGAARFPARPVVRLPCGLYICYYDKKGGDDYLVDPQTGRAVHLYVPDDGVLVKRYIVDDCGTIHYCDYEHIVYQLCEHTLEFATYYE